MFDILVIVPTRNNMFWIKQCLKSIACQTVVDFKCVVVDDCSNDKTADEILDFISSDKRFSLVVNPTRYGPLFARFIIPKKICKNKTLVITVDGDDRLANIFVFEKVKQAFSLGNLVIYGKMQVIFEGGKYGRIYGREYSNEVKVNKLFRKVEWVCGAPRCFSSILLKYIDEEKYLKWNGEWIPAATDKAMFYCLMEIAGVKICFIDSIMYEYHWWQNQHMDNALQLKYNTLLSYMKPLNVIKYF